MYMGRLVAGITLKFANRFKRVQALFSLWAESLPLPVAEEGRPSAPQPRLWRAVAKQARERQCGKAEEPFLFSSKSEKRNGS